MTLIYNIGIALYYLLILIASPFNKKAKLWIIGRKEVFNYLKNNLDQNDNIAWFHVSSLGEFEQGRPIIEAFKTKFPNYKILLTFFSPSGYEIRKDYSSADYICYLPNDNFINAKRFIKLTKPKLVFLVKYDFWFHHLKQAKKSGARLFLISGAFRNKQTFFKWYGGWYRQILTWFEHFFIQDKSSDELLHKLGVYNSTITGDSRFDRVVQIAQKGKTIDIVKQFSQNITTIVCGSTWQTDEEFLIKYLHETKNIKLILAPHKINQSHIQEIEKLLNIPYALYSKANKSDLKKAQALIIDNIGILSSLYKYGQIAYIGGGFGVGIHNTLEAAVYSVPVIFGPNYNKFCEAKELISCNGGKSYSNYTELKQLLDSFIQNSETLNKAGKAAGKYVKDMTGATDAIIDFLSKTLC